MRYFLTIFYLSFSGLLFASPNALPPPVLPQCLGVSLIQGTVSDETLDRWQDSGYGWTDITLHWADIEKTKNSYNFTDADALLARLTAHHLKPLIACDTVNSLYLPGASASVGYTHFLTAVVQRYRGKPLLWEVGPSLAARQAVQTIKAADPEATVALSVSQDRLQTDLAPALLTDTDAVALSTNALNTPEDAGGVYEIARRLIQANAPSGRQIPLIVSSGAEISISNVIRRRLFDLASGVSLSLYTETAGGLPSAVSPAMRTLTRTLSGFRFIKRVPLASSDDYLLLFSHGKDGLRIVVWTAGLDHTILLPIPLVNAIVDIKGDNVPLVPMNGRFPLVLTSSPEYLDVSGDAALRQAAAWVAVPQDVFYNAGQPLKLTLTYHNPDTVSHRIRFLAILLTADGVRTPVPGGEDIIPPDRTLALTVQAPSQAGMPAQIRVGLTIDGVRQPYPQDVGFEAMAPLTLSVAPLTTSQVQVQITNPGRDAFVGRLNATTPSGIVTVAITLKAGTSVALVTVPIKPETNAAWRLRDSRGRLAATLATQRLVPYNESGLSTIHSAHYQFAAGDTSWQISEDQPVPLPGKPFQYGVWIFGDQSGIQVSVGFTDSTGQAFHTDGPFLTWTGWRFVTFSLRPVGETVTYPLQITALLRLRSLPNPAPHLGVLFWKEPTIIYAAVVPVHRV